MSEQIETIDIQIPLSNDGIGCRMAILRMPRFVTADEHKLLSDFISEYLRMCKKALTMTPDTEHQKKHKRLYVAVDELLTDFVSHTETLPSKTTLIEFIEWSYKQTLDPTEEVTA